jgi:hypothetical protein
LAHADTDLPEPNALPKVDALLAGTVALMTAFADPCPQTRLGTADLRQVLARKVVSNLFCLQHHSHVSPELRLSLAKAHARWVALAQPANANGDAHVATGDRSLH